jgi:hypothetical protein
MRVRNYYGIAGSTAIHHRPIQRVETGPRRPITARGRAVLEASRRRTTTAR